MGNTIKLRLVAQKKKRVGITSFTAIDLVRRIERLFGIMRGDRVGVLV